MPLKDIRPSSLWSELPGSGAALPPPFVPAAFLSAAITAPMAVADGDIEVTGGGAGLTGGITAPMAIADGDIEVTAGGAGAELTGAVTAPMSTGAGTIEVPRNLSGAVNALMAVADGDAEVTGGGVPSVGTLQTPLTTNLDGFTNNSVADGSVSIVDGAARFNTGTSAGKRGLLDATAIYSLPDGAPAHFRIKSMPGSGAYQFHYYLGDFDADSYLRFSRIDGTDWILTKISAGSATTVFDNLDFDENAHRWIRFVRSGTNILMQTAPDSGTSPGTWTTRGTVPIADLSGFDEDNLYVEIDWRYNGTSNQILEIEAFNTDVGG